MEQSASTAEFRYGGFWIRLVALLIDSVVIGIAFYLLGDPSGSTILSAMVGAAYYIGFWTWRGQTLGKMALGLKVVRTDGSPISLGRAILRYIGYLVSTIIIFIGFLMVAWDGRKQGLHDKIADTLVIRTR